MDVQVIYHLTPVEEWEDAQDKGTYEPSSFQKNGFVHCCTKEQLELVREKHFQGQENLVRLAIDTSLLHADLKYDFVEEMKQEFPHVYGSINLTAVTEIVFLEPITSDKEKIDNPAV